MLRLANATLDALGLPQRVAGSQVEVVVADHSPFGVASQATLEAVRLLARTEGLIADPVYKGWGAADRDPPARGRRAGHR